MIEKLKSILPKILKFIELADEYSKMLEDGNSTIHEMEYNDIKYLYENFNYEELVLLEALMYIGRDDYVNPDNYSSIQDYYIDFEKLRGEYNREKTLKSMYNYLLNLNQSTAIIIDQMISKRPFPIYLQLDILGILKLNLTTKY
ncbi:hypothetical protein D3C76_187470 [compost metagenome]